MSFLRTQALRQLSRFSLRTSRTINQRRWAQVHDVRFLATTRPAQSPLDKYKAKLDEKAKQEGYSTIDELKSAYSEKIGEIHRKDAEEFPTVPQTPPADLPSGGETGDGKELPHIPQAPNTGVKQPNAGKEFPFDKQQPTPPPSPEAEAVRKAASGEKQAIKGLDDIIDLEKCRPLPDKELTAIWRLRHANSENNICAVIPAATYKAMEEAAESAPQFVLPVPHETQGAEIHFLQWTFDAQSKTSTVLFTQLAEFKLRGEFAQPHTTVTHHLDLADDRGLVLMQGKVMEGRGIQPEQARWLVMCLQRFYGGWEGEQAELSGERRERAEERKNLVDWFAKGDERFTVEKLLEEAERMG